jgi:DNA-binding transcriptional ArsR family regulator
MTIDAWLGVTAELLPMSRPAVSQHLKVLQDADLVHTQVRGRYRWHELSPGPLVAIQHWAADLATRHATLQEEP